MRTLILLSLFLVGFNAFGYETDQYSVSPEPLADVGEDLSKFVHGRLQQGMDEINRDLTELPGKILRLEVSIKQYSESAVFESDPQSPSKIANEKERQELALLQARLNALNTEGGLIAALQAKYSGAITWNEQRDGVFGVGLSYLQYPEGRKNDRPVLYNQSQFKTIYSLAGFHRIISPSYFVFASTLNAYGVKMGVDKFGHFLNQGFEYYEKYQKLLSLQVSATKAIDETIQWGVQTEDGLFGMIVDGVYSNGDLAANFAGFVFYSNFFHDLQLEGEKFPRLLDRDKSGFLRWNRVSVNSPENLLRRFVTAHLDESLNPSVLESPQRGPVRRAIRERCREWIRAYGIGTAQELKELTDSLVRWKGYSYGHRSENAIRLEEVCADQFADNNNL